MSKNIFVRMDARYTGYPSWQFFIPRIKRQTGKTNTPTHYESMQVFFQWRRWCWTVWGPSKELSNWLDDCIPRPTIAAEDQNPQWCWVNDKNSTRIYLRGDQELTAFLLKWA
jgi:hypothetical protein